MLKKTLNFFFVYKVNIVTIVAFVKIIFFFFVLSNTFPHHILMMTIENVVCCKSRFFVHLNSLMISVKGNYRYYHTQQNE